MSKSRGNVVNPWDVFGAARGRRNALEYVRPSPPGNSRRFSVNLVGETVRKFMNTLWNTYSFFVTYSNLSDWALQTENAEPQALLDRWLLSELNMLVRTVTEALESYDVLGATRPIAAFVDSLSNWYVRSAVAASGTATPLRSTRFTALATVSKLLAPSTPFIAEEMYQNLVAGVDPQADDSVHLSRWPQYSVELIDERLNADMALVQKVASLGHSAPGSQPQGAPAAGPGGVRVRNAEDATA